MLTEMLHPKITIFPHMFSVKGVAYFTFFKISSMLDLKENS